MNQKIKELIFVLEKKEDIKKQINTLDSQYDNTLNPIEFIKDFKDFYRIFFISLLGFFINVFTFNLFNSLFLFISIGIGFFFFSFFLYYFVKKNKLKKIIFLLISLLCLHLYFFPLFLSFICLLVSFYYKIKYKINKRKFIKNYSNKTIVKNKKLKELDLLHDKNLTMIINNNDLLARFYEMKNSKNITVLEQKYIYHIENKIIKKNNKSVIEEQIEKNEIVNNSNIIETN